MRPNGSGALAGHCRNLGETSDNLTPLLFVDSGIDLVLALP